MATRTVKRPTGAGNPIVNMFTQYMALSNASKDITSKTTLLKKELSDWADKNGEKTPEGHLAWSLPENHVVESGGKRYTGFMRQRRVSQSFNEDRAEELCSEKGFSKDEYISTQEYVDQDKVARLYAEDRLTDEEFASLVEESVTWAFLPIKES